jgi:hypothetical protein
MKRALNAKYRYAEAIATATAGTGLGGTLGFLLAGWALAIPFGISAGINAAFGGYRQVYDWSGPKGWFALFSDSTWALIGTTLGNVLNLVNVFTPTAGYRDDFSRRQNRHVFEKGACMKRGFAFTHGCVISNASTGRETLVDERRSFIDRHEDLHIWQNRWFGPLYQGIYVVWFAAGALVGVMTWIVKRQPPKLQRLVETAAYYDNPFEFWAYKKDEHWHDNSADPVLKWRRPRWTIRKTT